MTTSRMLLAAAAGLSLPLPMAAGAQAIWRCGPDGTRFQDRPWCWGWPKPSG